MCSDKQTPPPPPPPPPPLCVVCTRKVIGQRGSHVSELRKATGAVVDVEKDESGAGTVTLSGEPMAVDAARSAIEALLDRAD